MDYVTFFLVIIVLVGIVVLLNKFESRTKNRYKRDALRLLETPDPSPGEVKSTLRGLHLYSGRIKKDKEALHLARQLYKKHGSIFDNP